MDYNDYIDEMQDRCEKKALGKDFTSRSMGLFSGVTFDKNGNII